MPLSDLFRDDQATAWMQVSHTIETCLGMAHENIRAVEEMLRPQGELRVPMYAHYPVMRSILEAAAEAKYILEPDDRRERIARALRSRLSDVKYDGELRDEIWSTMLEMEEGPTTEELAEYDRLEALKHAKHMEKIKLIAREQGIPWASVKAGLPGTARMIRSVGSAPGAPGGYVTHLWKIMSGLSHPSVSRSVNHSMIEERSESSSGVIDALVTASLEWTSNSLTAALGMTLDAVNLFAVRRASPFTFNPRVFQS